MTARPASGDLRAARPALGDLRIARLALGDFRDRVRRPAYAVTLLAAVGLAYLAVPDPGSHWVIMDVAGWRGVYNSAYVGTVTALAGALWLTFGGFYVIRGAIGRDQITGVGALLAASPLSTPRYLAAKFLSNLMVLVSMAGVLAVTAFIMQPARGESASVHPVDLLLPFVVLTLPVLAITAALAILFDTVPLLRTGLGNVVWFFVGMAAILAAQAPTAPLGGLGMHRVGESMRAALTAQRLKAHGELSLGLTYRDTPLRPFHWTGAQYDLAFEAGRLLLLVIAATLAVLPALWFRRFDPARSSGSAGIQAAPPPASGPVPARMARPLSAIQHGNSLARLLAGETLVLLKGVALWWWLVAAGLSLAGLAAPLGVITGALLPASWIWPVLIWSRLGTQHTEYGLDGLLDSYPRPHGRMLASWLSGLALTTATGSVPMLRMAIAADWSGMACWAVGVLFIPSFALALGTVGHTHRLFQALYLPLWYGAVNHVAAADFMGTVRSGGHPVARATPIFAVAAMALLALSLAVSRRTDTPLR